ncbi:transcriptional repressor [Francisella sp. 19X1-34]|uniref:transcriptional repressor n=1 Tax=Francisella sp. 19X1-34 TaxID=3087177 RepID=UPI002E308A09|nr:transcriptional repressor [Francisella sp. 19X1-34]MED7787691.1 transcriptional repressor [Francisella sp. 19X1-34]
MSHYLKKAQLYCEKNKHRFTKPRQEVLQVIMQQTMPIAAYDILKILSIKKEVKPPTIYRAIDFWSKHGFIHRVESLNSYIACDLNHKHQGTQVIICDNCGMTKEICLNDFQIVNKVQSLESFKVKNWNVEIHGLCQECA